MAEAALDGNRKPTLIGVSNADASTPTRVYVNPATGRLLVDSNASLGGTADGTAFVADTSEGSSILGVYESTPTAVTDGDLGIVGIDANRSLKVSIETDNAGIGGGTQYAYQAAAGATDTGTAALVVRNDTLSDKAGADGDYAPLQVDANGGLYVTLATALAALVSGAENDSVLSLPGKRADGFQSTITSADATSATSVKAKTAAKKIYVTDLLVSTDTAMNIQFQDDAGTPNVLMEQFYMPANSVLPIQLKTPLEVATNQDLDVIASAAGNISVTCLGYVL